MPIKILAKNIRKISYSFKKKESLLLKLIYKFAENRSQQTLEQIQPYLQGKILDIGMGAGTTNRCLKKEGYRVVGIDIENLSIYPNLKPIIYNGSKLPFTTNEFDTALLICVLHHCGSNRVQVLKEAKRVAKRLIIIEDTFRNPLEKALVSFNDMWSNFEFFRHPYWSYEEFKNLIKKESWKTIFSKQFSQFSYNLWYSHLFLFVIK